MKIGIISDIHGNYPALEKVLVHLHSINCQKIICLGDICGYYSMVNECIELLRNEKVICLKGNHDSYLLGESKCLRSRLVNHCIEYQKKIISFDNLKWLKSLMPKLETSEFYAVHGGWNDPLDEYMWKFDFSSMSKFASRCNVFLSGHTHVQSLQRRGNIVYCNPGAVGQPRDYNPCASYAVLDGGNIEVVKVPYNIEVIAKHMYEAGFEAYYYNNLYYGTKIGERVQHKNSHV